MKPYDEPRARRLAEKARQDDPNIPPGDELSRPVLDTFVQLILDGLMKGLPGGMAIWHGLLKTAVLANS